MPQLLSNHGRGNEHFINWRRFLVLGSFYRSIAFSNGSAKDGLVGIQSVIKLFQLAQFSFQSLVGFLKSELLCLQRRQGGQILINFSLSLLDKSFR